MDNLTPWIDRCTWGGERLGVCMCRGGCTAALDLLKKIAERGPWAAVLQDAFDWVNPFQPQRTLTCLFHHQLLRH